MEYIGSYLKQKKIQQRGMRREEGRAMARTNNEVSVNKGVLDATAGMVKSVIKFITDKDSLSAGDTEAIRADHSPIGEIIETERKYVSEADGLVEVSFQIPCRDWMILKKSIQWHWMGKKLREIRNKYIRKFH